MKRTMIEGGHIEGTTYYFYLTDHLGNNRVVANGSGAVIQKNAYYPFGMAFATTTAADQNKQPFKYGAKELDRKFGLNNYDFEARHYDPAYSRFTTIDPLAEKFYSWSPYNYCLNNPLIFIDPTGETVYLVDQNGIVTRVGDEDDEDDVLIAVDANCHAVTNDFQHVKDKNFLRGLANNPKTSYTGRYSTTSNATDAFNVFKYVADNTGVEWGLNGYSTKDGNQFLLSTSHSYRTVESTNGSFKELDMKFRIHSHPYDYAEGASGYSVGPPPANKITIWGDLVNADDRFMRFGNAGKTWPGQFPNHYVYLPRIGIMNHYTNSNMNTRAFKITTAASIMHVVQNKKYNR